MEASPSQCENRENREFSGSFREREGPCLRRDLAHLLPYVFFLLRRSAERELVRQITHSWLHVPRASHRSEREGISGCLQRERVALEVEGPGL